MMTGKILEGKYRIERLIGSGGMGVVAEATHLLLEQRVALKFPRQDLVGREDAGRRFLREARATFSVRSEHVVRVLDLGFTAEDGPFIAMEYLEGKTLAALLDEAGKLPFETVMLLMMQAMRGVEAAHRVGLVHRDLKPSNLFVTSGPDGAAVVKVLDFGIAKPESNALAQDITVSGARIGSPAYMSPEQMRGGAIDARTDIWALGVILYQLVAGVFPFEGDSPQAMIAKILVDPPRSLRVANPEVPTELETVVLLCLHKDPGERPKTVEELRHALAKVVAERPVRIVGLSTDKASQLPSSSHPSLESLSTVVSAVERNVAGHPAQARRMLAAPAAALALGGLAASVVKLSRPEAHVASVAPPRKEPARDVPHEPPRDPMVAREGLALLPADVTRSASALEAKPAPSSSSYGHGFSVQPKRTPSRVEKSSPPSFPSSSEIEIAIGTRR